MIWTNHIVWYVVVTHLTNDHQKALTVLLIPFTVSNLRLVFSMSGTRVNTVGSEFRTILTRIREVKETLEQTDNVELARQLEEVNDSLRILEGNQSSPMRSSKFFKTSKVR